MKLLNILIIILVGQLFIACDSNNDNVYFAVDPGPGSEEVLPSHHFSIKFNGKQSFVYQSFKRNSGEKYLKRTPMESMSWTSVVCSEMVDVEVTFLKEETLGEVIIRPKRLQIQSITEGNTVKFKMPAGKKVTIEEKGKLKHVCFLFGHNEEPQPKGDNIEDTVIFKRGVHELDEPFMVKSNQAVILEPGAFVKGRIHGEGIENAQILGRGIISGSHVVRANLQFGEGYAQKRASRLINLSGKNLRLQGPTVVDAPFWTTRIEGTDSLKPVKVSHMSVLGWYVNSDGFQDMENTRASDLFTCVNDDAFILNNGGNCIVERAVIWGQVAGAPLRLGWNGKIDLDTIIYRDIDVVHFVGYAGIISLKHGGPSHVKDIFIENLYVEEPVHRLIELEIKKHIWSPKNSGFGRVSNIQVKNVYVDYPLIHERVKSHIMGQSEEHMIENILLENINIAGEKVDSLSDIPVKVNEFTKGIVVK
ncbi:MAG: hypothetical protein MI922_04405 [Bacteroidales bacterium]|nr:hypothetical protein [Bacteroidales bacterium]